MMHCGECTSGWHYEIVDGQYAPGEEIEILDHDTGIVLYVQTFMSASRVTVRSRCPVAVDAELAALIDTRKEQ